MRFARTSDKQQIVSLLNELGAVINKYVSFDPDNEMAHILGTKNYDKVMKNKNIRVFVLEDKKRIIAVASYFILIDFITASKFAHIDDFVVTNEERGKGYGTRLMKGILQYSKEHHINTVKLTSSIQLKKAHKFYENLGGKFVQKVIKFSL